MHCFTAICSAAARKSLQKSSKTYRSCVFSAKRLGIRPLGIKFQISGDADKGWIRSAGKPVRERGSRPGMLLPGSGQGSMPGTLLRRPADDSFTAYGMGLCAARTLEWSGQAGQAIGKVEV